MVAHRGGALVYPESSAEAFEAVAKTDFPIEMDLRALEDGTLVPLHDATVDRTMTGIAGEPEDISIAEWRSATVQHPVDGAHGTPITWDEIAAKYGRDHVLVPEIKDSNIDLDSFAKSILDRKIEGNVIAQSFDYTVAKDLADAGLNVLYLLSPDQEIDPPEVVSDGISYVGPNKDVGGASIAAMKEAGLTVWPWTVNDPVEAVLLLEAGADGVFTDDPWMLADALRVE